MLALPDNGPDTAKFREFEKMWALLQAAYTSNVHRALDEMEGGLLKRRVDEREEQAKEIIDLRMAEMQVTRCNACPLHAYEGSAHAPPRHPRCTLVECGSTCVLVAAARKGSKQRMVGHLV